MTLFTVTGLEKIRTFFISRFFYRNFFPGTFLHRFARTLRLTRLRCNWFLLFEFYFVLVYYSTTLRKMPTKSIKKKRRKKTLLITRVGHKRIYLLCTNLFWNMHHELGFGADKNWFSGLFTFYLIKLMSKQ